MQEISKIKFIIIYKTLKLTALQGLVARIKIMILKVKKIVIKQIKMITVLTKATSQNINTMSPNNNYKNLIIIIFPLKMRIL